MDAKFVLLVIVSVLSMCFLAEARVVFNFHEKIRMATSTAQPENLTKAGQIIRVPELRCPYGQKRDLLGNCRMRL